MEYARYFIFFFLLPVLATAGDSGSSSGVRGGGKGVVCRNADGAVRSVELLDLWEARTLFGRTIQTSSAPVAEQVAAALAQLAYSEVSTYDDPEFNRIVRGTVASTTRAIANRFLSESGDKWGAIQRLRGVVIAPTDDSFEQAWPSDCAVEQIVAYNGWARGSIAYVNQDLFEKMDSTNQAALIVHEAFYASRVEGMNLKSSVRSRRAVGYVFAGGDFSHQPDPSLPHVTCKSVKLEDLVKFALFTEHSSDTIQGAVLGRYDDESAIGFFPSPARVFEIPGEKVTLKSLFDYKENCARTADHFGATWPLAIIGGAGPADFDRSGTLVGLCRRGRLETFWSKKAYANDAENLIPVRCNASK